MHAVSTCSCVRMFMQGEGAVAVSQSRATDSSRSSKV
uniref:Uncharacterized protein n=1 Tax=Anopheles dirus TaxID=7168 RepID=A0A182NVY8_9DIPT